MTSRSQIKKNKRVYLQLEILKLLLFIYDLKFQFFITSILEWRK